MTCHPNSLADRSTNDGRTAGPLRRGRHGRKQQRRHEQDEGCQGAAPHACLFDGVVPVPVLDGSRPGSSCCCWLVLLLVLLTQTRGPKRGAPVPVLGCGGIGCTVR